MSAFIGEFLNTFKSSYMRNHKAVNTKNLRCFPVCGEEHRDNGFCGNEVILRWRTEGRTSQGDFETYAEFQEAEEPPRFQVGQAVTDYELSISLEDKDRKRSLMKGETKDGPDFNTGTVHFARESKGWHYGWMAGRGNGSHALHEMRVYLFERTDPNSLVCRLLKSSSPFVVTSRKRARKKKEKDGVEDDDDDDEDDSSHKRVKKADPKKDMKKPPLPTQKREVAASQLLPLPNQAPKPAPKVPGFAAMLAPSSGSDNQGPSPRFEHPGNVLGTAGIRTPGTFVPGSFISHMSNQCNGQSGNHFLQQQFATMQPPAMNNARLGPNTVQWPFLSSTPPIYQHSNTPPVYGHPPSTTPPLFMPFQFGNNDMNFPNHPVTDAEVLDSLLQPTPPSMFSNISNFMFRAPSQSQQVFMQNREERS